MTHDPSVSSFDLVERPWIPVLDLDGHERELSLAALFAGAGELRRLVGDIPTQEFALVRLLLAILHDVVAGPADTEDWAELWAEGIPQDEVTKYLHDHRDRFDLLHPEAPFFQVVDLQTSSGDVSSLNRLVGDVPNGALFFTQREQGVRRLTFAEAARWLVHAHAYDPSGIKSGAVGDPRVKGGKGYPQGVGWAGNLGGVMIEGRTLEETLLLNLVATEDDSRDDRPAWRFSPTTAEPLAGRSQTERPYGVRDLYTWQTRRIRLHHDTDGVHGVVLCYGDTLAPHNMHDREPMTGWRRSVNQEKKLGRSPVYLPREHDPARSAWRGLASLIAGQGRTPNQRDEAAASLRPGSVKWVSRLVTDGMLHGGFLIRTRLAGAVYGTQQAVIDEVVDDRVTMPLVLLHDSHADLANTAIAGVQDADAAVMALGQLAGNLAKAVGANPASPQATARDLGYGALDAPFRGWLQTLLPDSAASERRAAWRQEARKTIRALGEELVAQSGETAWTGRLVETSKGELWLNSAFAARRFDAELNRNLSTDPSGGEAAA